MPTRWLLAVVAATVWTAPVVGGNDRNPVGERADYQVDRDRARTSSMILGGSMVATVTRALPDNTPPSYEVKIDYAFDIQWIGTRSGTEQEPIDAVYFTEGFLEQLRRDGYYESPQMKIRHLGFADARNMDGRLYQHCDKLLIYDIQQPAVSGLVRIAADLLAPGATLDQIENLEILAHVQYGVPVLGAAKLDASGDYDGMHIIAGGDYVAPAQAASF